MRVGLWLVPLLPALGFAGLLFFGKRIGRAAGWVATAVMVADVALVGALIALAGGGPPSSFGGSSAPFVWWASPKLLITFGLRLDALAAVMVVVVVGVAALVHLFSVGYMAGDQRFSRYFAYLQLFSAAMLLLVLADNLVLLYVGWELVGLSSYLLIGFWFEEPQAADAAKKAFITTRIGDVGLLVGVLLLGGAFLGRGAGTYDIGGVLASVAAGAYPQGLLTAAALCLLAGAVGKSAQFPLHVWLPDAMEGPTPVSALIHAATMVAAGVYLVARMFGVFAAAPVALAVVAVIGAFTALMAATIAIGQTDIKKVLAYSTISQLGLMFLALGVSAPEAAMFHLLTHAAFKSLLFLGAGAVIHSTTEQDIRRLGGLARRMPITAGTFVIGAAALAGIPPLAGFFSKDEVLSALLHGHGILFVVALLTSLLTAIYIFRVVFTVFFGKVGAGPEVVEHAHDGPWTMTGPLVVLAVVAAFLGLAGSLLAKYPLVRFLVPGGEYAVSAPPPEVAVMVLSFMVAAAGVALAWLGWGRERLAGDAWMEQRLGAPYRWARAAYRVDQAYRVIFVRPLLAFAAAGHDFDRAVIDGAVDAIGSAAIRAGRLVSAFHNGRYRRYAIAMLVGAALIVAAGLALRGP